MLSQDGVLLCHCDKAKLRWYVAKGLAVFVEGRETPTVQLTFAHKNSDQQNGEGCEQVSLLTLVMYSLACDGCPALIC